MQAQAQAHKHRKEETNIIQTITKIQYVQSRGKEPYICRLLLGTINICVIKKVPPQDIIKRNCFSQLLYKNDDDDDN
jgi:hypothetical protein